MQFQLHSTGKMFGGINTMFPYWLFNRPSVAHFDCTKPGSAKQGNILSLLFHWCHDFSLDVHEYISPCPFSHSIITVHLSCSTAWYHSCQTFRDYCSELWCSVLLYFTHCNIYCNPPLIYNSRCPAQQHMPLYASLHCGVAVLMSSP